MNYLAHAYLSFNHPGILVGNLISDFVKGRKKYDYPDDIQKGIALHRAIDTFTDSHEATRQAKQVFRPVYRLYSGAFVDVVYDHFLANDENEFTESSLLAFSQKVYSTVNDHLPWLPASFSGMFPFMKTQNWLYNYKSIWGTGKSFGGLVHRAVYLSESETAIQLFEEHYQRLQDCYRHFWAAVKPFAYKEYEALLDTGRK